MSAGIFYFFSLFSFYRSTRPRVQPSGGGAKKLYVRLCIVLIKLRATPGGLARGRPGLCGGAGSRSAAFGIASDPGDERRKKIRVIESKSIFPLRVRSRGARSFLFLFIFIVHYCFCVFSQRRVTLRVIFPRRPCAPRPSILLKKKKTLRTTPVSEKKSDKTTPSRSDRTKNYFCGEMERVDAENPFYMTTTNKNYLENLLLIFYS